MHDPPPRAGPVRGGSSTRQEEYFQTCRTCLATNVRMCDLQQYNLSKSYAALVGYPCAAEERMPDTLCYECARKLNKFKAFRAMSRRAYTILRGLLDQYGEISNLNLKDIDRKKSNLGSTMTQCDLGHVDVEPVVDEKIFVKIDAVEICLDKNKKILPNKHENEDTEEHVMVNKELRGVEKLEIEFEHEYVNEFTSNCYISELQTPKQEDVKTDMKHIKSNTELSLSTKAGANEKTHKKKKSIKKSSSRNEDEKPERSKRKSDDNDPTTVIKQDKTQVSLQVKPKRNRKKPGAKQHTQYTKEYYEKIAVVTVMTQEEQMEFFKQYRLKYLQLPYQCEQCGLHMSSEAVHRNHMKKHEVSAGDVVCDICKFSFKSKILLAKHICMIHRTKFECRKCDFVTAMHCNLRMHALKHHDTPFFCDVCETTFDKLKQYTEHVYGKHPASMSCASCGVTVFTVAALKRHRARVHNAPEESSGASGVPCAQCGVVFRSEEAYKVHRTTYPGHDTEHGLIECGACSEQFDNGFTYRKHMEKHKKPWNRRSGYRLDCEQCGEIFNNGREYYFHFREAHPGKTRTRYFGQDDPLICELCGKLFQKQFMYQRHMDEHNGVRHRSYKRDKNSVDGHRSARAKSRTYKCKLCHMKFATAHFMSKHKLTHSKEKPQCTICGKHFTEHTNLSRHMKYIHTDETPYSCDVCNKSFKEPGTLYAHVQHVHEKIPWPKRDRTRRKKTTRDTNQEIEESI